MNNRKFLIGADTPALRYVKTFLENNGCHIAASPSPDVTHLVLNIPTFSPDGNMVGGGDLTELLTQLPNNVTVIGGKLDNPILQEYSTWDLLQNEAYLAENAAITADCALRVALFHFPAVISGAPVLILGWGRIAKCLAQLLKAMGATVTIAARKEADIAIAGALGYGAIPLNQVTAQQTNHRIIFNTVPAMVLPEAQLKLCRRDCLKIDLASVPGIAGDDIITARGLPGKMVPESAGHLIAKTILELSTRKEVSS